MLEWSFRGSLFSESGFPSPALGAGATGFSVVQGSVACICLPSGPARGREALGCAWPCLLCLATQSALFLIWFASTNPRQVRTETAKFSLVSLTNLHFTLDVDPLPILPSEARTTCIHQFGKGPLQTERQAATHRLITEGG